MTIATAPSPALGLGACLGLKPLDRVLVRRPPEEVRLGWESWWAYFQQLLPCGRIVVAGSTFDTLTLDASEIEDIEIRESIEVYGKTVRAFHDGLAGRPNNEPPVRYTVMGARATSSGSFTLHISSPETGETYTNATRGIVTDASWAAVAPLVRRDCMPVRPYTWGRHHTAIAGGSADRERKQQATQARRELRRALAGRALNGTLGLASTPGSQRLAILTRTH